MYNLVKRQPEVELFPLAAAEQLGVIVYSPLASGLLTGLYGVDRAPEKGRLNEPRYQKRYATVPITRLRIAFTKFAEAHGFSPSSLAVAWAMSHPAVTAPIIGRGNRWPTRRLCRCAEDSDDCGSARGNHSAFQCAR